MGVLTLLFAGLAIFAFGVFWGVSLRDDLADEERDRLVAFADALVDCKNYWRDRALKAEQPDGVIEEDGQLTEAQRETIAKRFRVKVDDVQGFRKLLERRGLAQPIIMLEPGARIERVTERDPVAPEMAMG